MTFGAALGCWAGVAAGTASGLSFAEYRPSTSGAFGGRALRGFELRLDRAKSPLVFRQESVLSDILGGLIYVGAAPEEATPWVTASGHSYTSSVELRVMIRAGESIGRALDGKPGDFFQLVGKCGGIRIGIHG